MLFIRKHLEIPEPLFLDGISWVLGAADSPALEMWGVQAQIGYRT